MAKKPVLTAAEAAKMIPDGATVMCGGFLACGQARAIVKELVKLGTKDLTLIANDMGRAVGPKGEEFFGIAELIHNHQVKRVIATHVGMTPEVGQQNTEGTLEVNLLPQGTLAECIRAGGAGLGAKFVAICLLFFAFSTILGWYFFGQVNFNALFGSKYTKVYSLIVVLFILIGSSLKVDLVWALADFFNGLMAVPNLLALLALSGVVAGIARNKKD